MAKPAFPPASGSPEPAAPRATGDPPWRYENAAPQRSTDAPPASGPGEFTRMFHPNVAQSSGSGSVLPPAAKQPAVEGEFTRMMKAPPVASDNLFTPTGAPQPDVFTERPAPIERDDFSRVANAGRETPQQAPASGKVEASPAAKPHASNLPVILIVGGLLLITLVLVVVFAVMR